MELEGQEGQGAQEPQQEPQQPSIDPRAALEIAAQQFGTTPDYLEGAVRLQDENRRVSDEMRRRQRELEIREAKLEALERQAQRYQPPEPTYQDVDPTFRPFVDKLSNLERLIVEERRERAEKERMDREVQQRGVELRGHFESVMRGVPTQNQVDPNKFFGAMEELWPDGPPPSISPERAVGITARYLGLNPNGGAPLGAFRQSVVNPRDPRAQYVVPATPASAPAAQVGQFDIARRPGDTREQHEERLQRALQELGGRGLTDGQRVSSG